jgi:hypothetical protein
MASTTSQAKNPTEPLGPTDVPLQSLPVIELSGEQLEQAAAIAKRRNQSYSDIDGGVLFGDCDSLQSHEIGVLGELAVAEFYNTSVDGETLPFGDNGSDIELWGQRQRADVKTTATNKLALPQLLIRADKDVCADVYIRAHIIECEPDRVKVRLLGYASQTLVKGREPRRHPGTTKNFVVEPRELSLLPFVQDCHTWR